MTPGVYPFVYLSADNRPFVRLSVQMEFDTVCSFCPLSPLPKIETESECETGNSSRGAPASDDGGAEQFPISPDHVSSRHVTCHVRRDWSSQTTVVTSPRRVTWASRDIGLRSSQPTTATAHYAKTESCRSDGGNRKAKQICNKTGEGRGVYNHQM